MTHAQVQQLLNSALAHHRAGELAQAESLYRQVLAADPNNPDALHLLGLLARQLDRNLEAAQFISRAINSNPNVAAFHNSLADALAALGRHGDAAAAAQRAVDLQPDFPDALNNLASALVQLGRFDRAVPVFRRALTLLPDSAALHFNLANTLIAAQQTDPALAEYQAALRFGPDHLQTHVNLAAVLLQLDRPAAALVHLRRVVALDPTATMFNELGNCLRRLARLDEAQAAYARAADLAPEAPDALNNLGTLLADQGRMEDAIRQYRAALERDPNFAVAHNNLANACRELDRLDEAERSARRAIERLPDLPEAHSNLATILRDQGRIDEAIAGFRTVVALRPGFAEAHSNLLYTLYFAQHITPAEILSEHRSWAERHAEPLTRAAAEPATPRDPERPLRIGYVSPDFRHHPIASFVLPIFLHHDRSQFELFCYSDTRAPDDMTARLRAAAAPGHWQATTGLTHADLADLIRSDQIDILVDLALHSADNRMLTFARRPAPVQVSYLGYPGTTGLSAIQYRLTDPHLDPPNNDSCSTERSLRLRSYWCYSPAENAPPVPELPALRSGHMTFISLNNFAKCSPSALQIWTALLDQIPGSRLVLFCPQGAHRQRLSATLHSRVDFLPRLSYDDYLAAYTRADIALDAFPYNGGTTTCDALWMGLPVITLPGRLAPHRAGASILAQIDLPELIAESPRQYIEIARVLAADLPRLAGLRATLRDRMIRSPLTDSAAFTRDLQRIYREIWRTHCQDRA